ncbi:predicted protein [Sclerotinia sclerotiorum 1980 UF-70]|uniref:Uncharacterized protein n=2 Tax=Sclerotinia sclerotiorum (strain ATCC 18683 / 1980 / Ss-1) TaxID=665079 RepID=A7F568_SCLS1|nr:predicted protein [Sclerotinia sclerotiorum 1980 UF-70]APA06551.1 hypothetical protein sscle_02g013210 [Sclerotinia sclerotiorum 1980 UF-70]EDN97889.1 predicted protein [Sclerotinia sclerotiorum 1980 UF-70]
MQDTKMQDTKTQATNIPKKISQDIIMQDIIIQEAIMQDIIMRDIITQTQEVIMMETIIEDPPVRDIIMQDNSISIEDSIKTREDIIMSNTSTNTNTIPIHEEISSIPSDTLMEMEIDAVAVAVAGTPDTIMEDLVCTANLNLEVQVQERYMAEMEIDTPLEDIDTIMAEAVLGLELEDTVMEDVSKITPTQNQNQNQNQNQKKSSSTRWKRYGKKNQ